MNNELTKEDRERIEQEAKIFAYRFNTVERTNISHRSYVSGAEYATKFERERQAELRKRIEERLRTVNGLMQKMKSTLYWHERKEEKDFLTELLSLL